MNVFLCLILFAQIYIIVCQSEKESDRDVTIVVVIEAGDEKFVADMKAIFDKRGAESGLNYIIHTAVFEEGLEQPCFMNVCKSLEGGVSLILDLSWRGFDQVADMAFRLGVPYQRVDTTIGQFVHAADDYLENRSITDAVLIFQNDQELHQGLHYLIGNSIIRILVLSSLTNDIAANLTKLKPMPLNYVTYGKGAYVSGILEFAKNKNLVKKDSKWVLVYSDFSKHKTDINIGQVTYIQPKNDLCCQLFSQSGSDCKCDNIQINEEFTRHSFKLITSVFEVIKKNEKIISIVDKCGNEKIQQLTRANETFSKMLRQQLKESFSYIINKNDVLQLNLEMNVVKGVKDEETMGKWTTESEFLLDDSQKDKPIFRHFRVGVAWSMPFTFNNTYENGTTFLDGFCIQLLEKMKEEMNFTYETVFPTDGSNSYGSKFPGGGWDGLIGDLVNGSTDFIVAALTMTSEREEAIDFVAPHFDQTGISIVMKKPEKEVSLFKFMSVLDPEVWWCILGAIILTAIVLWILDKYSPFSGQNKKRYPYECRKFNLVECFWFALTSITPQGGGEPPKAISARILVAAYWLFVVLMLATFTANLAAFLTVERMQTPVSSLEELAKQSKINYTVVNGSTIYQYFENMANAEEELYKAWKDLTLSSSVDQKKYRVWDYPIKEQYGRIFKVIKESGMFETTEDGFNKVKDDKDGSFAFIHDTAEVRYEVYKSCDLLEVGEPFAEQPYAIAVQAGSPLQEEISKKLLDLQKDRYFEILVGQFWNASKRRECPNYEETEGINLQSLGGVFIATLVGLTIGMLTLVGEVVLAKKKKNTPVQTLREGSKQSRTPRNEQLRTRVIHPRPRLDYRY